MEMPLVEQSFEKGLQDVVHSVLAAQKRPRYTGVKPASP
jgi:hypothetical protein